jgi:hypothetical protein
MIGDVRINQYQHLPRLGSVLRATPPPAAAGQTREESVQPVSPVQPVRPGAGSNTFEETENVKPAALVANDGTRGQIVDIFV